MENLNWRRIKEKHSDGSNHITALTLFRPSFSFLRSVGEEWERSEGGVEGGGAVPPPLLNSENIEARATKLVGQLVSTTKFPLRSTPSAVI